MNKTKEYTEEEWLETGKRLFGDDKLKWKFQCPACNRIQSAEDLRPFKDNGAKTNDAYQKCRGRFTGGRKGPDKCDWAAFGLFCGPDFVLVKEGEEIKRIPVFSFAALERKGEGE